MGLRVEFEIFGDKQIDREFLRFNQRASDIRPVGEALHADFLKIEELQFSTEGRYGSGGWHILALSTIRKKTFAGLDRRILHATLALRRSLTEEHGEGTIREIQTDGFRFGTRIPYAQYHQRGTSVVIRGDNMIPAMPRRRPVEFPAARRTSWVKVIQRFIVTGEIATKSGNTGLLK